MKNYLFALLGLTISFLSNAQITISEARALGVGSTVTIKGVVTNGSELGSIRYMQDGVAGIAAYGNNLGSVQRYDSITVTGVLIEFSGLLEISPVNSYTNHGQATVIPTPLQLPIPAATEEHEGKLIEVQNVTFVQSGSFATGNSTVQLTDGTNIFDVRINLTTNIDGTVIPAGTVSVIGELGEFNGTYQIIPRDLNDIFPYVAPDKEINILFNGNTVLNGSTYFVGAASTIDVSIENLGTNNLTISGHTFTGANPTDFTSTINASTVTGSSNSAYSITYVPAGIGSRFATISIGSDDADENPYVIYLEGVGTNNFATEPSSNPSNLIFSTVLPYRITAQYTAGTGATKYIVLWKNGSAITATPADGDSYLRGDVVGDARVAYVGAGTGFTPRGIIANQTYYFKIFAYNGQDGYENYLLVNPASGTATSTGSNIGTYYSGISASSPTLVTDLRNLINPHNQMTYFSYKQTMMNEFEIKDTTNGQSYVTCAYSGERKIFSDPFDWTATGYSREHTYSHSWMPTFPADSPEEPEYTDQHHLFPTNLDDANTPRSNLPLDDIDGSVVFTHLEGRVGYKGTQMVYEPRASQKGNAARAIMYMAVAYNFPLNGNVNATKQDHQTLLNWHYQDVPDNYEIARHEYIFSLQENRNPFIDSVDFACHINIDDNSYVACSNSIQDKLAANLVVFPVPSSDKIYIQVNGTVINAYSVTDMSGRMVKKSSDISEDVLVFNSAEFSKGMYTILVNTPFGEVSTKMIVE